MARKLHIGGTEASPGWEIMNILPGPHVDHTGNSKDLSRFADGTFMEIYASHVLEHFDYQEELLITLKEWRRVLLPSGRLYVSVPDLDVLARQFLARERLDPNQRFHVMRMIFGGHTDRYDYHFMGFNDEFLYAYLTEAGFTGIRRVAEFGIFPDTSSLKFAGELISLNMIAEKP